MESGLRAGPIPSGVPVAYLAWMSMLLRYRGRFPWWGELRVPRYQGPLGCLLRRRRGGPWAPPPRDVQVPGDVHGSSCWIFLCWSWSCFLLVCSGLFVSRVGSCLVIQPFKTRPVSVFCLGPSLSFCLVCSPATFFSLFLFFFFSLLSLRRWGNPNPKISPCDSSSCARTSTSTRSSSSAHTSRSSSRTCIFFFFLSRRRSRGLWSVFCSRGGVSVRSVFWLVQVACLLSSCTLASCLVFRETATPGFRPQWRLAPFLLQIGSSRVTRLLLGVDPGTVRSAAGRGRGRHCDPTNS